MATWLSFFLLLTAILAAHRQSHRAVKLYFRAQFVYTLVVFLGVRILGNHVTLYGVLYAAVTLPILETCCFLVWEAGVSMTMLLASIDFGLLMGITSASAMRSRRTEDYVTFCEGVLLAAIGLALLAAIPTSRYKVAVRTIGTLSMALSTFDFTYLLNAGWESVNGWLPSAMCTVAFLIIAYFGPRREAVAA